MRKIKINSGFEKLDKARRLARTLWLRDLLMNMKDFLEECDVGIDIHKTWIISKDERRAIETVIEVMEDCL